MSLKQLKKRCFERTNQTHVFSMSENIESFSLINFIFLSYQILHTCTFHVHIPLEEHVPFFTLYSNILSAFPLIFLD